MKAALSVADLVVAAKFLSPAVMSRPVAPVLGGVMIAPHPSGLRLRATDYESFASAVCPAHFADEFEPVLVSYRLLGQVLSVCKGEVHLSRPGRGPLVVSSGAARWELPLMPVEEFPDEPGQLETVGVIDGQALAAAARRVSTAASADDSIPMLTAMCMDFTAAAVRLVATDRYRIHAQDVAWAPETAAPETMRVLVSARHSSGFFGAMAGPVEFGCDDMRYSLTTSGRTLAARQIDGTSGWVPYQQFLEPTPDATTRVVLEAAAFSFALRQASALAEEEARQRQSVLTFSEGTVRIDSGADQSGRAGVDIEADVEGDPITIQASIGFLLEAMAVVDAPSIELSITAANKPVKVSAPGEAPVAVVMPVRRPG